MTWKRPDRRYQLHQGSWGIVTRAPEPQPTMDFKCKPYTQKPLLWGTCSPVLFASIIWFSKVVIHWEFREGGGRQNEFWSSLFRKKVKS